MILTPAEMQAAESTVFAKGITAEYLMEEAGLAIARAIKAFCPGPGTLIAWLGTGHNAGDALVAARHLEAADWKVELRPVSPPQDLKPLTVKKRHQFLAQHLPHRPPPRGPLVLLDGLLGIGAQGPLRGAYREATLAMNQLRKERFACTVAIDLPTGLDGESGFPHPGTVEADITLTLGFVKTGLPADEATPFVGRLDLIPLPEIEAPPSGGDASAQLLTRKVLRALLPPRSPALYKTQAGRVGILAGSIGFTGAACLTAEACVASGAGMVSLYVPESIYPIVASRTLPEVMVHRLPHPTDLHFLSDVPLDVLAIGPGLGANGHPGLIDVLSKERRPIVLDADGLNQLARAGTAAINTTALSGPRLLTPHPGEFNRLFPDIASPNKSRREQAEAVVHEHPLTLLLKGTRTVIAAPDLPTAFNSTGHPGMASAGMGDVLTGLAAGFAAQGHSLYDSACLAAWLSGRSAEIAISNGGETQETLRAQHIIYTLAAALQDLRTYQ